MQDEALKLLMDIREALEEIDSFTAGIDLPGFFAILSGCPLTPEGSEGRGK